LKESKVQARCIDAKKINKAKTKRKQNGSIKQFRTVGDFHT
jgi:hypothetical protein